MWMLNSGGFPDFPEITIRFKSEFVCLCYIPSGLQVLSSRKLILDV
jgi:hypothetical protein